MSDGSWIKRTAQGAANATGRVGDRVRRGTRQAAQQAKDAGGAVADAASVIPALIASIDGPTLPLRVPWRVGLGQVVGAHPSLPAKLRGVAGGLDRLGYLELSPVGIAMDGESVPWAKIKEVRFGPATDLLTADAMRAEISRLTSWLPRLPGRNWLVRQTADVLIALCLAAAGAAEDKDGEAQGTGEAVGVPVAILYGGPLRRHELHPGVFPTLVAGAIPAVPEAIATIARAHGAQLTVAPPSRARRQAIAMREAAAALSSRLRGATPEAIESGEDEDAG